MTDLSDLVDSLKREVAVPGTFATVYPNTTDEDIIGLLADAFAAAQLEGFFGAQTVDFDAQSVTPDLSTGGRALVLLYAAERMLMNRILSMRTRTLYEAGPTRYETENAATVLTAVLKALMDRKAKLLLNVTSVLRSRTPILMGDAYSDRVTGIEGVMLGLDDSRLRLSFFPYELGG